MKQAEDSEFNYKWIALILWKTWLLPSHTISLPETPPNKTTLLQMRKCLLSKQFNSFPLAKFYRWEHNPKAIIVSIINTLRRILILQLKSCWSLWHATINVSIIKNYKLFGDYFDNFLSSSSCKEKKQIFEKISFKNYIKISIL